MWGCEKGRKLDGRDEDMFFKRLDTTAVLVLRHIHEAQNKSVNDTNPLYQSYPPSLKM